MFLDICVVKEKLPPLLLFSSTMALLIPGYRRLLALLAGLKRGRLSGPDAVAFGVVWLALRIRMAFTSFVINASMVSSQPLPNDLSNARLVLQTCGNLKSGSIKTMPAEGTEVPGVVGNLSLWAAGSGSKVDV